MPLPNPQPEWMATLRAGEVLTNGRSYRVVRNVSRWRCTPRGGRVDGEGPLRCVTFAIRRCSWTKRCYTVYTASDLKTLRFRPAGARVKLNRPWDEAIAQEIENKHGPRLLSCCDVRGAA